MQPFLLVCGHLFKLSKLSLSDQPFKGRNKSMILGYPDRPSVLPGGTPLTLHVSTDAPQFRVDFYRQGRTLELKQSSDWLPGQNLPSTFPLVRWDRNWGWPGYDFVIPPDWPSGAHI